MINGWCQGYRNCHGGLPTVSPSDQRASQGLDSWIAFGIVIADEYWDLYACDTFDYDLLGHLLSYPIRVTHNREVTEHPGLEHFSDTKARVLGSRSEMLPSISLLKIQLTNRQL
ncbi:hypothetical protein CRYUN_Cryun03dG0069600 [Craigia yunnanensis]